MGFKSPCDKEPGLVSARGLPSAGCPQGQSPVLLDRRMVFVDRGMLCVTLPFKPAIVFHCGEGVGGTGSLRGWAIAVFV